jgi:hypothetical protein
MSVYLDFYLICIHIWIGWDTFYEHSKFCISLILSRALSVIGDMFRLIVGFIRLFDTARDYTLQFTITYALTHTGVH